MSTQPVTTTPTVLRLSPPLRTMLCGLMPLVGMPIRLNLETRQITLLIYLHHDPHQSAATVAARMGMPKSSITRAMDRLVKEGLGQRHPDPTDKRKVLLSPTPKAGAILRKIEEATEAFQLAS